MVIIKQVKIMALTTQKEMNNTLAARKPNFKKAYDLFCKMNDERKAAGQPFFTMPNLQKRFNDDRKTF